MLCKPRPAKRVITTEPELLDFLGDHDAAETDCRDKLGAVHDRFFPAYPGATGR